MTFVKMVHIEISMVQEFSVLLTNECTFSYFCLIHPDSAIIRGTLINSLIPNGPVNSEVNLSMNP
jgi:hypothetical protein